MSERRLPVYLVLDCSGSMMGDPIEAVRHGIRALVTDLRSDPIAMETAYLSVITFHSSAQQVIPLTELMSFQEPNLEALGSTALGAALKLLEERAENEVRKTTPELKGDWRPLVFIMTDGQPTDNWEAAADRIKANARQFGAIVACAAGSSANPEPLKRVTEHVVQLNSLQPEELKRFFQWVSSSIKSTSYNLEQVADNAGITLPPPPPQIQIVP